MTETLTQAIARLKAGESEIGLRLLQAAVKENPLDEQAWLTLADAVSSSAERQDCLNHVLEINPDNRQAKRALKAMALKKETTPAPAGVELPAPTPVTVVLGQAPESAETTGEPATGQPLATLPHKASGTYDLFISYSRKDKPFVQHLYETLLRNNREVWIDWGNIPLTADWRNEIREGIERADAVAFILSPSFLASEECAKELAQAEAYHKRLIPLVYQDVPPEQVPPSLASLNWIFFRHPDDFDPAFLALQQALDTDLEWVKIHTHLLIRCAEWDTHQRDKSFLLRGRELAEAEVAVAQADKNPAPTLMQKQYILTSRQQAIERQRSRLIQMGLALVISISLAILAFVQFTRAEAAQQIAEEKRLKAEEETRIALSRLLGAQAIIHADDQPGLAALLSLKAGELDPTDSTLGSKLLSNLRHSPYLLSTLTGHTANVRSIDFSPDGQLLASGSKDQTIILWDMATLRPVGPPLTGHTNRVQAVAFSPDGKILASASRDGTVRLWDVTTRQPLGEPMVGHTGWVNAVAFNKSGTLLASAGADGRIVLWNPATRTSLRVLAGHNRPVTALAFNPTGNMLASGSEDNTAILWDADQGRAIGSPLTGHQSWINDVAFTPDGKILATAGADRVIRLWEIATGQMTGQPLEGHPTSVTTVAFSPNGQRLISGSEDDSIIMWDVRTRQQLGWPLVGHANSVHDVAVSPAGNIVASASSDATIVLWDMSAGQFLVDHTNVVRAVDYSPDGQALVSGSTDTTVRLWDAAHPSASSRLLIGPMTNNGQPIKHTAPVWAVAFSPNGQLIASGGEDSRIILWDRNTRQAVLPPLPGHRGAIFGVAFSPDGQTLASGGEDGLLRLWDTRTGSLKSTQEGHTGGINAVAFSRDGRRLASGSADNSAIVWDTATGQIIGQPLLGHTDDVNSVDFSPDGQILATGSSDNDIILWDMSTGQPLKHLPGHTNRVTSVAFSPNGRYLASGSYDRNVIVWDVARGEPVGPPLIGHTNDVNSVAWGPDGHSLVSGSWDDTLILWRVNVTPWQQHACNIANRNLSPTEWAEFIGNSYEYKLLCPNN